LPNLLNPERLKRGDWVVIEGYTSYWDGCEGEIIKIDKNYGYIFSLEPKLKGYEREGAGFGFRCLRRIESEYDAAIKVLGEDYFA